MERLESLKKRLYAKLFSYCKNKQHYGFVYKEGAWCLSAIDKPNLVCIVARSDYSEHVETLPLTDQKAIASVIKLRSRQESSSLKKIKVACKDDSTTTLNTWQFNYALTGSLILLPETTLIGKGLTSGEVTQFDEKYFLSRHRNALYSSISFAALSTAERFSNGLGLPFSLKSEIKSESDKLELIYRFFPKVLLDFGFHFICIPTVKQYRNKLLKSGLATILMCCFGLGLGSAFLAVKKEQLQNQLDLNDSSINTALSAYQNYEVIQKKQEKLESVFTPLTLVSPIFPILQELRGKANIENMRSDGEFFIIKGNAESAIEALELLSRHAWVSEAQFLVPVTTYRGREEFVVRFELDINRHMLPLDLNVQAKNGGSDE